MNVDHVDAVVIGSGQGGVPLAVDFAKEGKRVVLFERDRVGGSCINYGCTPSKAFLAAAHVAGRARAASTIGVDAQVTVDFVSVMERVRGIRDQFRAVVERRLLDAGVEVIRARASFTGSRTVTGGGRNVTAPLVIINTGTAAAIPPIPGLDTTPYLTNANFFDLTSQPTTMLVLGGGYIGLELGQGLARCGATVHIVDGNERVLSREEPDASEELRKSLDRDGMHLHLGRRAARVVHDGRAFALTLDDGSVLHGDALLVAVGRSPNSADLNCAAAGVALDARGNVAVDAHFRTSAQGVYAIADVAGQPAFTHVSWEDYRRLKAIVRGEMRTRDDRVLAYTTFTEPQVARAGLTLGDALKKGLRARAVTMRMSDIARAIEWGHDIGFYRLVVDDDSDKILGATFVGYEAGEVIHVIVAHMEAGSTWRVLARSVHIHPTYGEALPSLARLLES
jgi:pyruvate/2-oxoglutarate dehydrogenase complex dihydrolipoamide dehydrogenase (E3) component